MAAAPEVFISYSRKNKDFAHTLVESLTAAARGAWIDTSEIEPSEEWWTAIKRGIDGAHTVVVIVTPESLASPVCTFELDYARRNNKRIIPVMRQAPPDITLIFAGMAALKPTGFLAELLGDADMLMLARDNWRVIEKLNWITLRETDDFASGFAAFIRALDQDLARNRLHTRLLVRARLWEERGRDASVLLKGAELDEAASWLTVYGDQEPQATQEQRAFITASQDNAAQETAERARQIAALDTATTRAQRNQRRALLAIGAAVVIGVIAAVLTGNAVSESQAAATREAAALAQAITATVAQGAAQEAGATAQSQAALEQTAAADARRQEATAIAANATAEQAQREALLRRAESEMALGDLAYDRGFGGDQEMGVRAYGNAADLFEQLGEIQRQADALLGMGNLLSSEDDLPAARFTLERALSLYEQIDDLPGQANTLRSLGELALSEADLTTARAVYDRALPLYMQGGNVLGQAEILNGLGDLALAEADLPAARSAYQQALPLYEQVYHRFAEFDILNGLGDLLNGLGELALREGDWPAARTAFERALPLFEQTGSQSGQAKTLHSLGDLALREGDPSAARAAYERALPLYTQTGDQIGQANTLKNLGDAALMDGDYEGAENNYAQADMISATLGYLTGRLNVAIGRIASARAQEDDTAVCAAYSALFLLVADTAYAEIPLIDRQRQDAAEFGCATMG